jgi:hypothetical protein
MQEWALWHAVIKKKEEEEEEEGGSGFAGSRKQVHAWLYLSG